MHEPITNPTTYPKFLSDCRNLCCAEQVTSAWSRLDAENITILLELQFPTELHSTYGAPSGGTLEYTISLGSPRIDIRFDLYNKTATRLPEVRKYLRSYGSFYIQVDPA
jgi:hypothetical protein